MPTLGKNAKAYYHTTAGTALASMTEMSEVRDMTTAPDIAEIDVGTRGNPGETMPGEGGMTCTFDLICTTASLAYIALRTHQQAQTKIAFAALSGAKSVSGSEGPSGDWTILQLDRQENLADAIRYSVKLKCGGGDYEWATDGEEAGT